MQRFFEGNVRDITPRPVPGSSFYVGMFDCAHCHEPCAQEHRFQVLACDPNSQPGTLVGRGSFCSAECAAGYNKWRSKDPASTECAARHTLLEKCHGRTIVPAPPPRTLRFYVGDAGLSRVEWMAMCRARLSRDEAALAEAESIVQRADVEALTILCSAAAAASAVRK
jgi:hypothetical protein